MVLRLLVFLHSYFLLLNLAEAQLPTNNIPPSTEAVMTDTNGNLAAPPNFFSKNSNSIISSIGVVQAANGGLGISNTNLVPAGAAYAGSDPCDGLPYYTMTGLDTTKWYYMSLPPGNDGGAEDTNCSTSYGISTLFKPLSSTIYLIGFANGPVGIQIYPTVTNITGFLSGQFDGTLTPDSSVPAAALPFSVQFQTNVLSVGSTNVTDLNSIYSANTNSSEDKGSTLTLHHAGPSGYTDINFKTTGSAANLHSPGSYTLWFAIGVGGHSIAQDGIYFTPYIESYLGVNPFYFVGGGQIFGGFYSSSAQDGDWIWYRDGTTNTAMFRINRANAIVSNYVDVACASNLYLRPISIAPAASRIGANGFGFWNSNGVLYVTKSANGSTISSTTLIAQ
jgi:hypothetical protein